MEATAYRQLRELEQKHWWFRGRRTVYLGLLRHHLKGRRPERILDLGSGVGGFLPGLAEIGAEIFPTDVSHDTLLVCRERGFGRGVVSNSYHLPYADRSFDLVCLFDALEHFEDDARAMREVTRILKPGGLVQLSVPAYQFLFSQNDRVTQHFRRYTRGSLARVLDAAGLTVERNTHADVFLFPLIAAMVLCSKLRERLFPQKIDPDRTNLSLPLPGFLQTILHGIFAAELPFSRLFNWPVGHSICALARRPASNAEIVQHAPDRPLPVTSDT